MRGVADRLRLATRAEHDRIELELDWQRRAATRAGYAEWLRRLHAFYQQWEPDLAATIDDPALIDPRRKLALLEEDLRALNSRSDNATAVSCPFTNRAEALGALYVLEGSTLGGQLIAAHVRATLGHEPMFHGSYGRQTAAIWRTFRSYLDGALGADDLTIASAAANTTFKLLREQLRTAAS